MANSNSKAQSYWAVECPRLRRLIPLWPVIERPGERLQLTGPVVFACPKCGRLHEFQSRQVKQVRPSSRHHAA